MSKSRTMSDEAKARLRAIRMRPNVIGKDLLAVDWAMAYDTATERGFDFSLPLLYTNGGKLRYCSPASESAVMWLLPHFRINVRCGPDAWKIAVIAPYNCVFELLRTMRLDQHKYCRPTRWKIDNLAAFEAKYPIYPPLRVAHCGEVMQRITPQGIDDYYTLSEKDGNIQRTDPYGSHLEG